MRNPGYAAPRFEPGQIVRCAVRGDVIVCGLSKGPIPWPLGKRRDGARARFLIVMGDLETALRYESAIAVAHWWGVGQSCVTRMRKALGVELANEGTHRLRHEYSKDPRIIAGFAKAHARGWDAARREKLGASRRGKPLSEETRQKLSAAKRGKKLSEEHRRRMAQALKGRVPVWVKDPWTAEEDELVRTLSPREVAERTGRKLDAIYHRRGVLGVSRGRGFNGANGDEFGPSGRS